MKNLNRIACALFALVLMASCGSVSISQKRYSRGLNIDVFTQKDDKKETRRENIRLKPSARMAFDVPVAPETESVSGFGENSVIAPDADNINPVSDLSVAAGTAHVAAFKSDAVSKAVKAPKAFRAPEGKSKTLKAMFKPKSLKSLREAAKADATHSDVGTLILVILSFIIPPLAVFLYFGEFETNFLISLLLVILAGGIFLGGGSPFWWTIAVIHALLVVLGIFG